MRDPVDYLTKASFWPSVIQQEARGERVYDLPSRLSARAHHFHHRRD